MPDSSGDPPRKGGRPRPKRGAFPTPKSVLENAKPYVPAEEAEMNSPQADTSCAGTPSGGPSDDDGEEQS